MAVKIQVRVEDYLRMSFEHDREYVRGEIVARPMPAFSHSDVQNSFSVFFHPYRRSHNLFGVPELRLRLGPDLIRIPDYSLFTGKPDEVPSTPPLVAVEITSPDDRLDDILEKREEYRAWGVPNIRLVQPGPRRLHVDDGALKQVEAFTLPSYGIRLTPAHLFA